MVDFPIFVLFEISKCFPPAHLAFLANKHYRKQYNDIGAWKEILYHEGNHWKLACPFSLYVRWTKKNRKPSFFPKFISLYYKLDCAETIAVNFAEPINDKFGFLYSKNLITEKEESYDLLDDQNIKSGICTQRNYKKEALREKRLLEIFLKIKKHFILYL